MNSQLLKILAGLTKKRSDDDLNLLEEDQVDSEDIAPFTEDVTTDLPDEGWNQDAADLSKISPEFRPNLFSKTLGVVTDLPGEGYTPVDQYETSMPKWMKSAGQRQIEADSTPVDWNKERPADLSVYKKSNNNLLDLFKSHLEAYPQREDYKASLGRKILAIALGHPEIIDAKYNRARRDWVDKVAPLRYGAQIEEGSANRDLANYLRMMDISRKEDYGKKLLDIRGNEEKRREQHDINLEGVARINAESNRRRADAAERNSRRGPRETSSNKALAESRIREMAINETLNDHPQYRRLLGPDGRTLIVPKTEQDGIDFANFSRITKAKAEKLRKKFASSGSDQTEDEE